MKSGNIGNQLSPFVLRTRLAGVKTEHNRYTQELASGEVSDIVKKLDGNLSIMSRIDDRISSVESYDNNLSEAEFLLQQQDISLGFVAAELSLLKKDILSASLEPDPKLFDELSSVAKGSFAAVMDRLNQQISGRSLFAGLASDQVALIDPQEFLDRLEELTNGANDVEEAQSVISDWFSGAGRFSENGGGDLFQDYGNFDNVAFLGNLERNIEIVIGKNDAVDISVKASDPNLKAVIEALAFTAVASEKSFGGNAEERQKIFAIGATKLHDAEGNLIQARSKVGGNREYLEEFQTGYKNEKLVLDQARNNVTRIDFYETFLALEETRTQMQTIYNLTARLSQLSLAEYLR